MWKRVEEFDKSKWNEYVKKNGSLSGRFLQSWEWGEFQKSVGEKVERFFCDDGVASVIVRSLSGFGQYAYCPCGPITNSSYEKIVVELARTIPDNLFFRFDVPQASVECQKNWVRTIDVQPSHTWVTQLDFSEEKLFESLHKKTRYNIGLAQRRNIEIKFNEIDFDSVWSIFIETGSRGEFRLHSKMYYEKMFENLNSDDCKIFLATAMFEQKPVAVNIMLDFGGVRTYLHGASSHEYRALMAPHLLHWELIIDAKQKGLSLYDWRGIAPSDKPNHPWAGITRFKKSFPGQEIVYTGTYDLVRKPFWYKVYQLARRVRRGV
jgi:lipid II:glycine glycyltransferase (peptidoglycan interpeptide bridge formation enzyme)